MANQYHNAIKNFYLIKNSDKLTSISKSFFNNKCRKREDKDVISEHQHVVEKFIEIPKVKNLSEFAFLVHNMYLLGNWESFHYRGESKEYTKPRVSSFLRNYDQPDSKIEIEEVKRFKNSEFGKSVEKNFKLINLPDDHLYWWFLTQHHSDV